MKYDDSSWYEENAQQRPNVPQPSAHDDFDQYPFLPASDTSSGADANSHVSQLQAAQPARGSRILTQVLLFGALTLIAFWGGWFANEFFSSSYNPGGESQKFAQVFQEAWDKIDEFYVGRDNIDYEAMSYAAINAMVGTLGDPGHTRFMDPQTVKQENEQLSGKFTGIGIYLQLDQESKNLIISAPIPGSPAEEAGIKPGDIIVAIDGTEMQGKTIEEASKLIQGEEGTSVVLTLQRVGEEQTQEVTVARAEIEIPNVIMHYIPESKIAHIQVLHFAQNVSGQLRDALTEAKEKGATSYILDLRDNPGGYLDEAIKMTSLFLEEGTVLLQQDSQGNRTPTKVNGNPLDTTSPLVVLVNENSASAAEIVAGSLQENKRAVVIGQRTFGTGTVLQQFNLSDGSALYLGTSEWLTPNGHFIRADPDKPGSGGITPDKEVSLSEGSYALTANAANQANLSEQQILESDDAQLIEAIQSLKGGE